MSDFTASAGRARLHALVGGRVQGVFFRRAAQEQARGLGLSGWVRNLPDGRVELLAEGERPALEMLLAWLYQGPPGARVEDLESRWLGWSGEFQDFRVR